MYKTCILIRVRKGSRQTRSVPSEQGLALSTRHPARVRALACRRHDRTGTDPRYSDCLIKTEHRGICVCSRAVRTM